MRLTLSERERNAYMAGDLELARVLDQHMVLACEADVLITHVEEDVPNSKAHRHLFEQIETVREIIDEVDV